jgi:hypothetical protein
VPESAARLRRDRRAVVPGQKSRSLADPSQMVRAIDSTSPKPETNTSA